MRTFYRQAVDQGVAREPDDAGHIIEDIPRREITD
jgi:hypothetical protein